MYFADCRAAATSLEDWTVDRFVSQRGGNQQIKNKTDGSRFADAHVTDESKIVVKSREKTGRTKHRISVTFDLPPQRPRAVIDFKEFRNPTERFLRDFETSQFRIPE